MNVKRIYGLVCAVLALGLLGCGARKATEPAPKPGVVYLDPNANAVPAAETTAAPQAATETAVPAAIETAAPVREEAPAAEPTPAEEPEEETLDLYFECRGVRVEPMMEAASVLAALGEPLGAFEADSCAYLGKDLFYAYPGVELTVNEVEGVERITVIRVTDDTVTIPQGLRIYDDEEKVTELLGGTDNGGIYRYRSGHTELLIQVKEAEGDERRVAYIEYRVAEDQ